MINPEFRPDLLVHEWSDDHAVMEVIQPPVTDFSVPKNLGQVICDLEAPPFSRAVLHSTNKDRDGFKGIIFDSVGGDCDRTVRSKTRGRFDAIKLIFSSEEQQQWLNFQIERQYQKGNITVQEALLVGKEAKSVDAKLIPIDMSMGTIFAQLGNLYFLKETGISLIEAFNKGFISFSDRLSAMVSAYAVVYALRMAYTIPRCIFELRAIRDKYKPEGKEITRSHLRKNTFLFSIIALMDILPMGASYFSKVLITTDRNSSIRDIIIDSLVPNRFLQLFRRENNTKN